SSGACLAVGWSGVLHGLRQISSKQEINTLLSPLSHLLLRCHDHAGTACHQEENDPHTTIKTTHYYCTCCLHCLFVSRYTFCAQSSSQNARLPTLTSTSDCLGLNGFYANARRQILEMQQPLHAGAHLYTDI